MDYCLTLHRTKTVPQEDIGVISPYSMQVSKIKDLLEANGLSDIEVGTVELFQGREKRAIITSTVRSKPSPIDSRGAKDLGFLTDFRRFNVTVTRAKELLVVIGNLECLSQDFYWRELIRYAHGNRALVPLMEDDTPFLEADKDVQTLRLADHLEKLGLFTPLDIHARLLDVDFGELRERCAWTGERESRLAWRQGPVKWIGPSNIVCVCGKAWVEKSKYSVIKEEFGDMQSFMETCHLKQSEDGFREANAFVDVLNGLDRDRWLREHQRCHLAMSDLPSDETLLMCLACL